MLCPHLLSPNGKQHTYSKETIALAIAENRQQQEEEGDNDDEGPPDAAVSAVASSGNDMHQHKTYEVGGYTTDDSTSRIKKEGDSIVDSSGSNDGAFT